MRHVEGTPFGARGGMSVVHTFPADGDYVFQVILVRTVSGELYGKPVVVVSAAPSEARGHHARESLERTLRMQGARVCDSFSVAVPRGSDPGAVAGDVLTRTLGALTGVAPATP